MPKKRKLNSKNPKYWPAEEKATPSIKEKRLINPKAKHKAYAVFMNDLS
tara:strand:+ start:98 stop:244 length:147 start_codon:yes stop_codon:yes gene_type:complete